MVPASHEQIPALPLRPHEQVRAAVLKLFCDHEPHNIGLFQSLNSSQWKQLLYWLDTSGLALYFFDRVQQLDLLSLLPEAVIARLQQNLQDNTKRIAELIDESCVIQSEFTRLGISYAVLKGFSLWPHSVPRLELRSQLDLDFLIATEDAPLAQAILERSGYRLSAISGRTREYKTPQSAAPELKNLYKPSAHKTVELHYEGKQGALFHGLERHALRNVSMPVLPVADLFMDQALHLYKHLSRDHVRCSHVVELYRHLLARRDDSLFWTKVEALCAADPAAARQAGVALELVFQQLAPVHLPLSVARWTTEQVPAAARLWIHRYGACILVAPFPGTKLYLLLQDAMTSGIADVRRSPLPKLIPPHLPPPISIAPADEALTKTMSRLLRQGRFILSRLRFHLVEGVRYRIELRRWHRLVTPSSATKQ